MIAAAALMQNAAIMLFEPHPAGSIQYPMPYKIPAIGRQATGSIKDLPIF